MGMAKGAVIEHFMRRAEWKKTKKARDCSKVDRNTREDQMGMSCCPPQTQVYLGRQLDPWLTRHSYVAGSVTRIKLINFMTYDHVEFRPGPHLNMILGPNGTGKSTVAAGIAIGLGFHPRVSSHIPHRRLSVPRIPSYFHDSLKPQVMGRATDLKSYVKQGCEEAQVEIELKAFHGKRNPVIWRRFNKHDEKSEWRLNSELATPRLWLHSSRSR